MKELLNNPIVQGIIVTITCAVIFWFVGFIRFKIDENKIYKFLLKSASETEHTFRGEPAISAETNLSEERINKVCSKSNKVTRNKNEKKSWRLSS